MAVGIDSKEGARRRSRVGGVILLALAALVLGFPAFAGARDQAPAQSPSNITVTQVDSPDQGGWCLPGVLVLTRDIHETPEYFELVVHANTRPCSPIDATAAIYAMPGGGVAWPQRLAEKVDFTISKVGSTAIRFTKTCNPAQFDVLTGETPAEISPLGPHHGPLLFPFDVTTSLQHWGCDNTTTTTDPCENYAARQLAVSPNPVAPRGTVTASGLGTPGTSLLVSVHPPAGAGESTAGPGTTVQVPESGQWSLELTLPADAQPGTWSVTVQASDCEGVTSATFTVAEQGDQPPDTPEGPGDGGDNGGGGAGPEVAGLNATNPLPSPAVLSATQSSSETAAAKAGSKLAWTGSEVRIPIVVGSILVTAGVLLLLRSRRRKILI